MQNTQPLICIGIPVYNEENNLRQRLESIYKQSFSNFEIIISDNASEDKTQKICEELSKKDKELTIFVMKKIKVVLGILVLF